MRYRIETDSLGQLQVPAESYFGIQTLRGKDNFEITKRGINRQMIKALAIVKKAAARANADAGLLDEKIAKAITLTCDEILNGRLHGQFITDLIQGGAGMSMNMNANEVIANRANEMLGGEKGKYDFVHPLDHVNFGQSTNDVIPTAGKIATHRQTKKLIVELRKLEDSYEKKAEEFKDIIKVGRTHLQDALPITLGQEFGSYASALGRDIARVEGAMNGLLEINMGATMIGTGLNASPKYTKKVVQYIAKYSGEEFYGAKNLIDNTSHMDAFLWLSSSLKVLASNLSKTANDIRLMASGPSAGFSEVILPSIQPGSTLIPGKYNPVVPEVVNQVAFYAMGLDFTITQAVEAGQLESNAFTPVILYALFESINSIRRAVRTFREKAVDGLQADSRLSEHLSKVSPNIITPLIPHLGYDVTLSLMSEAESSGKQLRDLVLEKGLMNAGQLDAILNVNIMTSPGILGEEEILENKKQTKEK
jgi:aspartate ammonia-lyase